MGSENPCLRVPVIVRLGFSGARACHTDRDFLLYDLGGRCTLVDIQLACRARTCSRVGRS
jgi:hypothetical protein